MIMNKREWKHKILFAALLVAIVFLSSCSKKTQKVYRVGILCSFAPFINIADGYKARMSELGYIEGQNIIYDLKIAHMKPKEEKRSAERFVKDKVDLIFAFSTEASITAKAATQRTDIPVVFGMAGIEGNNLVNSVHHPGGNITGVRYTGPQNTIKRFEILHELVPNIKRLYVTYNINYPANKASLEVLRPVVASMGIRLVENPVTNLEELQADLQTRSASKDVGIDAILIMPDDLSQSPEGFDAIVKFANKHKLPIGGGANFTADLGATFSFVPDFFEIGKMAANLTDKILKGTPAGTIMVVTARDRLRLNYKVIQELQITVPEGLLSRADEIIHYKEPK
jgi:putative ABC transport system substrate-binding protein